MKSKLPAGCFELVYNTSKVSETADTIKTTINSAEWAKLLEINSDENPYIKIEAIPIPCIGTGGVYEKEFFESFNARIAEKLLPGDKFGHQYISRQPSDFFTIGGEIKKNVEYLKIYIPPKGYTTDNFGLIRDAKMGLVHFSLVTCPEYNVELDDDGYEVRHFIATKGYERNDAVGYGEGAMEQTVNSKDNIDFDELKRLVKNGQFKTEGKSDCNIIENGYVMRPVLRAMLSHADVQNKSELSNLVSMIDKQNNGGKNLDTKEEAYKLLKNSLVNGSLAYTDVASEIGISDKLRNEADKKNETLVNSLKKELGENADLLETVKSLKKTNADIAKVAVENAVVHEFGNEKIKNGKNEEVENLSYTRAMELCANKSGDELKTALENAKKDPFILRDKADRADNNSSFNVTETNGKTADTNTSEVSHY